MRHLRLFKATFGDTRKPYYAVVEATDYGDAENRVGLATGRKAEAITELTEHTMLLTHFDYIDIQQREEIVSSQEELERPF